jgi:hypothetical protein
MILEKSMTLQISLPADAESRLKERAKAARQEISRYVERLLVRELDAPLSLAEASEPLARAVEESGLFDDEFTSLIVEARGAARRQRREKGE